MTSNTTTTTTTRRVRRNRTIKNVLLVLMAIALVIIAIFAFKGCNKDTTSDNTPGLIPTVGCTCTEADKCQCSTNNGATNDYSALLVEIDLLKAERDALKAENDSLKSGATADDKALAEAKADAASWKAKYETLYKTHQSCTSVDLSKYVSASDYNKLVNEYNALVGKYNDLDNAHKACGKNTVDLSQYVAKSEYTELTNKYNKLVSEFNAFKANHTNCTTYVTADHSNCVSKSTYQAVLNELAQWQNHKCPGANHDGCVTQSEYNALNAKYQAALNELAQWKNHKCSTDHSNCVSANEYKNLDSKYQSSLKRISALEAELAELRAHKCDHSNCGNGTTIIQADHSNCVSLRDYNELLAAYNALLND